MNEASGTARQTLASAVCRSSLGRIVCRSPLNANVPITDALGSAKGRKRIRIAAESPRDLARCSTRTQKDRSPSKNPHRRRGFAIGYPRTERSKTETNDRGHTLARNVLPCTVYNEPAMGPLRTGRRAKRAATRRNNVDRTQKREMFLRSEEPLPPSPLPTYSRCFLTAEEARAFLSISFSSALFFRVFLPSPFRGVRPSGLLPAASSRAGRFVS